MDSILYKQSVKMYNILYNRKVSYNILTIPLCNINMEGVK